MTVELKLHRASAIPVVDAPVLPQGEARLACQNAIEAYLAGASAILTRSPILDDHVELNQAITLFENGLVRCEFLCGPNEHRPAVDATIVAAKSLVAQVLALDLPDAGDLRLVDDLTTLAREQVATLWRLA